MSYDNYIMSNKIKKIDSYVKRRFNNVRITLDGKRYNTNIEIYGNYLSDKGIRLYYGKLLISEDNSNKHIQRNTKTRISRIYESKMKRIDNRYIVSIDDEFNFTITCKERLIYGKDNK